MNDELKPCPFCGGEADLNNVSVKLGEQWLWSIECVECGVFIDREEKDYVIKAWNTRKPMERIVERLEQQKQQYKRRSEEAAHVLQGEHFFGKMCSYDHAIEIVKGGGVDE